MSLSNSRSLSTFIIASVSGYFEKCRFRSIIHWPHAAGLFGSAGALNPGAESRMQVWSSGDEASVGHAMCDCWTNVQWSDLGIDPILHGRKLDDLPWPWRVVVWHVASV
jgi:hypothetical protein